jgi:hypothetical protein
MSQPLKVRLPVPDVLMVESVDHVLTHDVIRLIDIGLIGQHVRRYQVPLVNRCPLVTATNGGEDLVTQPCQIRLQVAENER